MLAVKVLGSGRTLTSLTKTCLQPSAIQKFRLNQCLPACDSYESQQKRTIHTSQIRRDLESAFRAIGAGIAATGVIGPGIGVGIVFGNLVTASARNPSMAQKLFGSAILGVAFCEALGLLAIVIAFLAFIM